MLRAYTSFRDNSNEFFVNYAYLLKTQTKYYPTFMLKFYLKDLNKVRNSFVKVVIANRWFHLEAL